MKIDYGTLSACVYKNQSLKVECLYPACDDNTPFNCDLYDVKENTRTLIGSSNWAMVNGKVSYLNASSGKCILIIKDHATMYLNKTKIYTCFLSRRRIKEEKNLTVKYNKKRKGKCQYKGFDHNEIDRKIMVNMQKYVNRIINFPKNE